MLQRGEGGQLQRRAARVLQYLEGGILSLLGPAEAAPSSRSHKDGATWFSEGVEVERVEPEAKPRVQQQQSRADLEESEVKQARTIGH